MSEKGPLMVLGLKLAKRVNGIFDFECDMPYTTGIIGSLERNIQVAHRLIIIKELEIDANDWVLEKENIDQTVALVKPGIDAKAKIVNGSVIHGPVRIGSGLESEYIAIIGGTNIDRVIDHDIEMGNGPDAQLILAIERPKGGAPTCRILVDFLDVQSRHGGSPGTG